MAGSIPAETTWTSDVVSVLNSGREVHGLLWDLDGTIVDSEVLYDETLAAAVNGLGYSATDEDLRLSAACHGMTLYNEIKWWQQRLADTGRPTSIAQLEGAFWKAFALLDASQMPVLPGVAAAIEAAAEAGIPQALATMSTYHEIEIKRKACPNLMSLLKVHVGADHPKVQSPKPAPDVFLVAASELGVDPRNCIAFEDTPRGVAAAAAAGCRVIAIPSNGNHDVAAFYAAGATVVVKSLAEIDFRKLFRLTPALADLESTPA